MECENPDPDFVFKLGGEGEKENIFLLASNFGTVLPLFSSKNKKIKNSSKSLLRKSQAATFGLSCVTGTSVQCRVSISAFHHFSKVESAH